MNTQRENPPFSTISGTMLKLGAGDRIAIYRWDDRCWVARFRDGGGELSDASAWFRVHATLLRSCRVGPVAAIETLTPLTPEVIDEISHLHRRTDAKCASQLGALIAATAAFGRACKENASTLRRWSVRLIHRVG